MSLDGGLRGGGIGGIEVDIYFEEGEGGKNSKAFRSPGIGIDQGTVDIQIIEGVCLSGSVSWHMSMKMGVAGRYHDE